MEGSVEAAGGGSLATMTAQQMLERSIVPVKAEYLVRKGPNQKRGDGICTPAAAEGASTAPTEPAASQTAVAGKKQGREQEQSKNKTRKQLRKDFHTGRLAELCTNYALGRCKYGEGCRSSHDLTQYVRSKPADLPGACPWTAIHATCPYGITCRYARTHGSDDELHRALATVFAEISATETTTTEAEPQPAGGPVAAAVGAEGTAAAAGDAVVPASPPPLQEPLPLQEPPCALPQVTAIEKETNVLSKGVQMLLWKNRYDYSRSDAILKSMDLRVSFKHPPKPISGSGGGGGAKKGAGAAAVKDGPQPADAHLEQEQQQQQGGPPSGPDSTGEADVTAVAKVEVAKEEVVVVDQLGVKTAQSTAMEVDRGSGDASLHPAADAVTPAPHDGPAAKRQRLDDATAAAAAAAVASPASDAAAVAALATEQQQQQQQPQQQQQHETLSPGADAGAADTDAASTVVAGGGSGPMGPSSCGPAAVSEARAAHVEVPPRPCERRKVDFRGKTYLAPLTTVGNLPFRRVCKALGVDVTCGEMALATNLMQGQASEWALMKRHPCEDFFGVQICGGYPDALARVGQLLGEQLQVDFVDINMGCPIDLVCDKNAGSSLLRQPRRIEQIIRATSAALGDTPLTFKTRKGFNDGQDVAHTFLHKAGEWGAAAVTLHGRTRQQRYSRLADWDYIQRCGESCTSAGLQLIGNGDVFSYTDWNQHMDGAGGHLASLMIGRGALIKPWIFTEIKEQRHWDISASERLDLFKQYCSAGLEHWGSDSRGVETTRRFLLEWMSFTCRYVPVGLLEVVPQQMNHRPPTFCGRSDLETLLASEDAQDWVRISEMLLGPPPAAISFAAKHKSNSYAAPGTGSELDMARG